MKKRKTKVAGGGEEKEERMKGKRNETHRKERRWREKERGEGGHTRGDKFEGVEEEGVR